jgi:DNA-binding NarL/FixJ family response regulator
MATSDAERIRVLLADDHRLVADSIALLLQQEFKVLGIAHDGRAMVRMARQFKPDVIICDITMPHLNGIDATRLLATEFPDSNILILTMHEDVSLAREAFRAGAKGFLLKVSATQELLSAVKIVAKGDRYITPALSHILSSGV